MLYVFVGSMFVNVCDLVPPDVVSVVFDKPPPPVVVNANAPLPLSVFFVSTMMPGAGIGSAAGPMPDGLGLKSWNVRADPAPPAPVKALVVQPV